MFFVIISFKIRSRPFHCLRSIALVTARFTFLFMMMSLQSRSSNAKTKRGFLIMMMLLVLAYLLPDEKTDYNFHVCAVKT